MKKTNKTFHLPYKWDLVILLSIIFFFNQADRQIFNVVLPAIRDDLNLTDADMGLIASLFTLIYGLMVPISGWLGDRISKKKIIIFSLLFWSTATLLTGICNSFVILILLRSVATGGGEAFYAPSANALIGEYHEKTLAMAMSVHQAASYFGLVISGYLAGYIAELYGWKASFYTFGSFGIILAIIAHYRIRREEPVVDAVPSEQVNRERRGFGFFFKIPTAVLLMCAFAGMVFVNVAFLTWMPTFLHEKFDLSLSRAGFDSTFYHLVAAFFGVIIGAKLSDRLAARLYYGRALIQMLGLLFGVPFIYMMGKSDSIPGVCVALALFGFFRGIYDSNIFAALYDVVEKPYRATATGIMLMFAFVAGSAAPYLLGLIKPLLGLSAGLSSLSIVYLISAGCITIALLFTYKKDIRRVL